MSDNEDYKVAQDIFDVVEEVKEHLPGNSWAAKFLGKIDRKEVLIIIGLVEIVWGPISRALGV